MRLCRLSGLEGSHQTDGRDGARVTNLVRMTPESRIREFRRSADESTIKTSRIFLRNSGTKPCDRGNVVFCFTLVVSAACATHDRISIDRSMPVRLVSVSSGKSIKLDKPVVLIGRNPDCDVVLTKSRKVSRAHCLVACVNNHIVVRDLGSTNGVWINGQRVERESRLRLGDELAVADVLYQLLNVDPQEENGRAAKKKKPKESQRKNIVAGNQPVPLPDEDDSFVVEATAPRFRRITPEQIAAAERDDDDSSCDVIPIDEKMLGEPNRPDGLVPLEIPDTGSEIDEVDVSVPDPARGPADGEFRIQDEDEDESDEAFSILDSVDESDDIVPLAPIDED